MGAPPHPTPTVWGLDLVEMDPTVELWKVSKVIMVPVWSSLDNVGNVENLEAGPRMKPDGH